MHKGLSLRIYGLGLEGRGLGFGLSLRILALHYIATTYFVFVRAIYLHVVNSAVGETRGRAGEHYPIGKATPKN